MIGVILLGSAFDLQCLYMYVFLFVFFLGGGGLSHPRIFHSYGDVPIAGEGLSFHDIYLFCR